MSKASNFCDRLIYIKSIRPFVTFNFCDRLIYVKIMKPFVTYKIADYKIFLQKAVYKIFRNQVIKDTIRFFKGF